MPLKSFHSSTHIEAGCDEAGRGCLAGPVVAAAVILPPNFDHVLLNDSKKMKERDRELLEPIIKKEAIAWAIGVVSPEKIDEINILNASFLAMHRAVDALKIKPNFLLIDGNRFNPYPKIAHLCVIQGDGIYRSIAAASVLAKVHRDHLMQTLHSEYPVYGWDQNKGYPTIKHRQAIQQFGASPHHRSSFSLLKGEQLSLDI